MKRVLLFFVVLFFATEIFGQPQPPANLTAVPSNMHMHIAVKLDWDPSPTPQIFYNVYRKDGALNDTIPFIKKYEHLWRTDFYDNMVMPGHTYSYYVTAYNMQGESEPSNMVEITLNGGGGGQTGGKIAGRILADVTNLPIPGSKAQIIPEQGFPSMVMTNQDGYFVKSVPPGNYFVRSQAMGFISEFYDNVLTIEDAQEITIAEGDSVFIAVGLAPYVPPATFTVSGSVTDTLGNPLRAMINAFKVFGNTQHLWGYHTATDSLGHYTLNIRENDTIVVLAMPMNFNYLPEFYNNKVTFEDADRIVVTQNITGIDFSLSAKPVYPNGIEGTVKNADGDPVNAFVSVFRDPDTTNAMIHHPHHMHNRRYTTMTDSLGFYGFHNMLPGEYILLACPRQGYSRTYFRYDGQPTLNWYEADSVVVTDNGIVTGINFTVVPLPNEGFASIKGTAIDNSGNPVLGAHIFALDINQQIFTYALTDANGNYVLSGLLPGEYRLYSDKVDYIPSEGLQINISNLLQTSQVDFILNQDGVTGTEDNQSTVSSYELYQNYPNPFNPSTTIKFAVPEQGLVKIAVYDMLGREVKTLINDVVNAGVHSVQFDASDLSSGVYVYKIQSSNFSSAKKLMLLK